MLQAGFFARQVMMAYASRFNIQPMLFSVPGCANFVMLARCSGAMRRNIATLVLSNLRASSGKRFLTASLAAVLPAAE